MQFRFLLRCVVLTVLVLAFLLPLRSIPTAMAECTPSHSVVAGENLSRIAQRYDTTVAELILRNPTIRNPNRIFVGQTICLPGTIGDARVHIRVEYTYAPHPEEEGLARLGADFRTGKSVIYPLSSGTGLQVMADTQEIKTAISQSENLPIFYGIYQPSENAYALVSVADTDLFSALRLTPTTSPPEQQGCGASALVDFLQDEGVEITEIEAEMRIQLGTGIDKPIRISRLAHIPNRPSIDSCIGASNVSVDFALFPVENNNAETYRLLILFPFTGVGPQGSSSILDCEVINQGSGLVYDFLRNFCPNE